MSQSSHSAKYLHILFFKKVITDFLCFIFFIPLPTHTDIYAQKSFKHITANYDNPIIFHFLLVQHLVARSCQIWALTLGQSCQFSLCFHYSSVSSVSDLNYVAWSGLKVCMLLKCVFGSLYSVRWHGSSPFVVSVNSNIYRFLKLF